MGKAIVLHKKIDEYNQIRYIIKVREGETDSYQATVQLSEKNEPCDGHWFIERVYLLKNNAIIIGVAHSKKEVPEKLYNLAVQFAKKEAKKFSRGPIPFIDKTRQKESQLVSKTQNSQ